MQFYEILQNIMDERDLTISEVAHLSDLPDSTVRSIISRKNKNVALGVAFKLSKGLNVSLEKLNGEMEVQPVKKPALFYQLKPRYQKFILNQIQQLLEIQKEEGE